MSQLTRFDDVVPIELHGAQFFPLSSPSRGGTELAVWQLRVAPGAPGTAHLIDREEVFVCQSGELLVEVDAGSSPAAEPFRLRAGDALAVPAGSRLSAGAGPEGAIVTVCTRAGLRAELADGTWISPPWAS